MKAFFKNNYQTENFKPTVLLRQVHQSKKYEIASSGLQIPFNSGQGQIRDVRDHVRVRIHVRTHVHNDRGRGARERGERRLGRQHVSRLGRA
jgi:hypothetical protein